MFMKKELTKDLKNFQINIESLLFNNNLSNEDKKRLFNTEFRTLLDFLGWKKLIYK